MGQTQHPYRDLKPEQSWRETFSRFDFGELGNLWGGLQFNANDSVATAGSCFAQHITRSLRARGLEILDLEKPPISFCSEQEANRWGYMLYSCRYGNIYTPRQLVQLVDEAFGERKPREVVWQKKTGFVDALRSGIFPIGYENADEVVADRESHLSRVQALIERVDVFILTLGLTEAWLLDEDGTVFPSAPGVHAGEYDAARYKFVNFSFAEVKQDIQRFWRIVRGHNRNARLLLTVSPVPLAATARDMHVLEANGQSKAVLRAVAGELAEEMADVFYFPAYEIISSHVSRGMFFSPDLRSVNKRGVEEVMKHFFEEDATKRLTRFHGINDVVCDEDALAQG